MRAIILAGSLLLLVSPVKALDIHFIDTEGGAATLIITPAGESVLIDCGNPGARDAERIHKVAVAAGLKQIDHLYITHWHSDHYGGVARLSRLIPIASYHDRGIPDTLADDPRGFPMLIRDYRAATEGKSKTVKAGDVLPLRQKAGAPEVKFVCLVASGATIADKPGTPENPQAKGYKDRPVDTSDNAKSLGFLLSYGDWRFLDLGDLTWNVEYRLISPSDKIGAVDVYQVTHHGQDSSNHPGLINTVKPRVAIMNNGARKGGHIAVMTALRRSPEIKAIYQMHRNVTAGAADNTDPEFIANPDEKCQGESIRLTVSDDARSYAVTVGSKGKPQRYDTRK